MNQHRDEEGIGPPYTSSPYPTQGAQQRQQRPLLGSTPTNIAAEALPLPPHGEEHQQGYHPQRISLRCSSYRYAANTQQHGAVGHASYAQISSHVSTSTPQQHRSCVNARRHIANMNNLAFNAPSPTAGGPYTSPPTISVTASPQISPPHLYRDAGPCPLSPYPNTLSRQNAFQTNLASASHSNSQGYRPQAHSAGPQRQSYPAGSAFFYSRGCGLNRNTLQPQISPYQYSTGSNEVYNDSDVPTTPLLTQSIARQSQAFNSLNSPPPPPQTAARVSESAPPPPPPEALLSRAQSGRRASASEASSHAPTGPYAREGSQPVIGSESGTMTTYLHVASSALPSATPSTRSRVPTSAQGGPASTRSPAPSVAASAAPTSASRFTETTAAVSAATVATTVQRVAAAINHNFAVHSRRADTASLNEFADDSSEEEGGAEIEQLDALSGYLGDDFLLDNPFFGLSRNPTLEGHSEELEEGPTFIVDDMADDPFEDPLLHADAYSAAILEEQRELECNTLCGRVIKSNEWRSACALSGGCCEMQGALRRGADLGTPQGLPNNQATGLPIPILTSPVSSPSTTPPPQPLSPQWPSERFGHTAVSSGSRMIVYGGRNCSTMLGDTWVYDTSSGTWECIHHETARNTASPSTSATAAGFSGSSSPSSTNYLGNNVILSNRGTPQQGRAAQLPSLQPLPRAGHSAIDNMRGSMIIFGGSINDNECSSECWDMDLTTYEWRLRTSIETYLLSAVSSGVSTPAYGHIPSPYVSSSSAAIPSPPPLVQQRQSCPSGCQYPRARKGHTASLIGRQHMVIFGGCSPGNISACENSKIWCLNMDTNRWKYYIPVGTPPAPRTYHVAAVAPARKALFVFGGVSIGCETQTHFNDLFELVFRCDGPENERGPPIWRKLDTCGSIPSPRMCSSVIMKGHTMYLLMGCAAELLAEAESHYELDTQTLRWRRLGFLSGHPSCSRPTTVLCNNTMVSFGGALSSMGCYSNKVYTLDLEVPTLKDLCREWLRLKHSHVETPKDSVPEHLRVFLTPSAGRRQASEDL